MSGEPRIIGAVVEARTDDWGDWRRLFVRTAGFSELPWLDVAGDEYCWLDLVDVVAIPAGDSRLVLPHEDFIDVVPVEPTRAITGGS